MRTLTGLSKPILHPAGHPLRQPSEIVDEKIVLGKVITVRSIIVESLSRGSSKEPVRAMDVALKIHNAKDSIELEDADFAVVEQAVKEDRSINNMAKAAALTALRDSREAEKEKKEKAD